ncbi:MAG: GNAT family N-acetyltransferase [Bryobacteraceae bacterium]
MYFRLSPEVWGKGLALFIGRSALKEAFERQGAESVIGKVRPANIPSRRALERLGMGLTGEIHDGPKQEPSFIYTTTRQGYSSGI